MRTIGIRTTPSELFYTIMDKEDDNSNINNFNINNLIFPKFLDNDIPRKLSYIRTTLFSIICEFKIEFAGIKITEGNSQTLNIDRVNIEGVIQELFSNSTVKKYFVGTFASLAHYLGKSREDITKCCKGQNNIYAVDGWKRYKQVERESFLAALASSKMEMLNYA